MDSDDFKKTRKLYLKYIQKILSDEISLEKPKLDKFIILLEKSILVTTHNQCNTYGEIIKQDNMYTEIFLKFYENNMRTLLNNCKKDNYVGNTDFLSNIEKEVYDVNQIASLIDKSPQMLFIKKNKKYFDDIEEREKVSYDNAVNINSQYKCRKCKQNKCTITLAQLRSADEPMSVLVTCMNCGHKSQIG
jgi:DNA-directed RNA polymerase subunit M/transcription elongation factor TFIIS